MTDRINRPEGPPDKPDALDELKKFSDEQMEKYGPTHWILNASGEVIPASLMEWSFWFEQRSNRVIQQDYIDDHQVSTIFEGLDTFYRAFPNPDRPPRVFETMVFGPSEPTEWFNGTMKMLRPNLWSERACTLTEALATHETAIKWLKNYLHEHAKTD